MYYRAPVSLLPPISHPSLNLSCLCLPISNHQATQVSPWLVTLDALEPFRCEAEPQDPPVLPYLQQPDRHTWDVSLTAGIVPAGSTTEAVVTRSNLRHLCGGRAQRSACACSPLLPPAFVILGRLYLYSPLLSPFWLNCVMFLAASRVD